MGKVIAEIKGPRQFIVGPDDLRTAYTIVSASSGECEITAFTRQRTYILNEIDDLLSMPNERRSAIIAVTFASGWVGNRISIDFKYWRGVSVQLVGDLAHITISEDKFANYFAQIRPWYYPVFWLPSWILSLSIGFIGAAGFYASDEKSTASNLYHSYGNAALLTLALLLLSKSFLFPKVAFAIDGGKKRVAVIDTVRSLVFVGLFLAIVAGLITNKLSS